MWMVDVVWFSRNEWLCWGFELWKDNGDNCYRKLHTSTETAPAATTDNNRGLYPPISNDPFLFLYVSQLIFHLFSFLRWRWASEKEGWSWRLKCWICSPFPTFWVVGFGSSDWGFNGYGGSLVLELVTEKRGSWHKSCDCLLRDEFYVANERFGVWLCFNGVLMLHVECPGKRVFEMWKLIITFLKWLKPGVPVNR